MSYGNKVDANHADLRDGIFRKLCVSVIDCSQFGMGFADLLILTMDGELLMVEIKDGQKSPSKRRLTDMQKDVANRFENRFLVATDFASARNIALSPNLRGLYSGIEYIKQTEST